MSCTKMPDFSALPDVVWVRILSCLTLRDRYVISQTCSALYDAFNHPSLWYKWRLQLLASARPRHGRVARNYSHVILPQQQLRLVEKFGAYFQDLELNFIGCLSSVPVDILKVLDALTANCRYEALTLSVGVVRSKREFWWEAPPDPHDSVLAVLDVIKKAYRLKTLAILSWQFTDGEHRPEVLLDAIRGNPRIKDTLSSLNLFYKTADSNNTWSTLNPRLPSAAAVADTVSGLPLLMCLKLQSPMLSDDLIRALAAKRQAPLKRLSVLVVYSRHSDEGDASAATAARSLDIDAKSWIKLKNSSAELQVDFTLVTRMPQIEKSALFKPEIPVASVNFMKYSECTREDLLAFADKYHDSLLRFTDYSQSSGLDEHLLTLTERCSRLNFLVFAGALHHHTVTSLAKLRGRAWYAFQVCSEHVVTIEPPSAECARALEEGRVLYECADGSYEYTARSTYQDELQRQALLEIMMQEVGVHLDRKWIPMDVKEHEKCDLIAKLYPDVADLP